MRRLAMAFLLALAAAFEAASPAAAQLGRSDSDWNTCTTRGTRDQITVDACSRAIASGRATAAQSANAHYVRGNAYAEMGEDERAIADLSTALRHGVDPKGTRLMRAGSYFALGDYDRALADLDEALRTGSPDALEPLIQFQRAWVLSRKGEHDRAIVELTRLISGPRGDAVWLVRGEAYLKKGDLDRAIEDLTKAMQQKYGPPGATAVAQVLRGEAYAAKGDNSRAKADYEAVLLQPDAMRGMRSVFGNAHEQARLGLARLASAAAPPPPASPSTPASKAPPSEPATTPAPRMLRRIALVIGNGGYRQLTALHNPVGDARAVAALLTRHGFQVIARHDVDFATMDDALAELARTAQGADEILVYYAGHGMRVAGRDLLAPIDFDYTCADETARSPTASAAPSGERIAQYSRGIELEAVLARIVNPGARKLIVIDACRDDPYRRCPARGNDGGGLTFAFRGLGRDSSEVQPLIVSSTQPGRLAVDGRPGQISPFAKAFTERLAQHPELHYFRVISEMVTEDVVKATNGFQRPQIVSSGAPLMCLKGRDCTWTK